MIYVVIATAVYDHGVVYVSKDKEAAHEAARTIFEDSDGHHNFRVEEMQTDLLYDFPERIYWDHKQELPENARFEPDFVPDDPDRRYPMVREDG